MARQTQPARISSGLLGQVPLIVAMTLLHHAWRKHPNDQRKSWCMRPYRGESSLPNDILAIREACFVPQQAAGL